MKLAINMITKTIVDILPDSATKTHKYLINNGYKLLELGNPYNEDGSFVKLTDEHLKPLLNESTIAQIVVLENSLLRPTRELLSTNTSEEAKAVAQLKIDEIEEQIQSLRSSIK